MKKIFNTLVMSIALSAFLFSCSKTNTPVSSTIVASASMDSIFNILRLHSATFNVDAVGGGTFYGNSGTRYTFFGNSFQTASGTTVTGTVQVQVCEYLQKGDMLFSKMLPISNKEPLISGGEINVSATQNGQSVYLKPYNYFVANVPQSTVPPAGMAFFSGQPNTDTTQNKVNWLKIDSSSHNIAQIIGPGGDTLSIISDSLKECNADQFMTAPNYQTFTVTALVTGATVPGSSGVFAYALYDNYKAVWPLGWIGSYANGVFTEQHVPNIPVHFVVFTLIGGKFYGGIIGATPVTGNNYAVTLTEVDPVVFKGQVNEL